MSQNTVEQIFATVQQLSQKERQRLSELLQGDIQLASQTSSPAHANTVEQPGDERFKSSSPEMQWLLDHPDFWDDHRGEHVALSGYEMIAVGKTRKEVVNAARRRGIQFPFVQYLPRQENEWLLGFSNQPIP